MKKKPVFEQWKEIKVGSLVVPEEYYLEKLEDLPLFVLKLFNVEGSHAPRVVLVTPKFTQIPGTWYADEFQLVC